MNKSELAERLAGRTGMSKAAAKDAVDGVFEVIGEALANGDEARILGFGTFGTRNRPARTARNPRTGETLSIAASTVPVFKAGKTLKDVSGQRSVMNGDRIPARGTRGADEGRDIECARLRHDDRRELWHLPTPVRIAKNQWVALEAVRFAHATRQNWQKRDGRLTGLYVFQLSGLVDYQKRCGLIADTWEMT